LLNNNKEIKESHKLSITEIRYGLISDVKGGDSIRLGVVDLPANKSPEDWNDEHGSGEIMDTPEEAEDRF